jgi:hypothetical protein
MLMFTVSPKRGVFSEGMIATVVFEETCDEAEWIEPSMSDAEIRNSKMCFGEIL